MDPEKKPVPQSPDPGTYLAAERTFLAWIRTGLALMGFGFVVARFGLFMREIKLTAGEFNSPPVQGGISLRFGTVLVILGVVLTAGSVVRYRRLLKKLSEGRSLREPSRLAVSLAVVLAIVGSAVSVYLLLTP